MNAFRILVASSNAVERGDLRAAMEFEGYAVGEAATGTQAVQKACTQQFDVLLMDSLVGGMGAHGLCRTIRPQSPLGIIVWGDRHGTTAIESLNAGADDFVLAPFVRAEMLARVRAILRRVSQRGGHNLIILRDRQVDLRSCEIKGPGNQVARLTPKEFLVLSHLVAHAGQPRTAQVLARTIWRRDGKGDLEYVRIVIRQLRRKLESDPGNPRYLLTERTEGYRFQTPSSQSECYRLERRSEGAETWARPV